MPVSSIRRTVSDSGFGRCRPFPSAALRALLLLLPMLLATAAVGQAPHASAQRADAHATGAPSAGAAAGQPAPPGAPHAHTGQSNPDPPPQGQTGSGVKSRAAVNDLRAAVWWGLVYVLLLVLFFFLAAKSDLLRSGPPPQNGARRPFSLARCQAAWWLFIVLGSYLLIGVITGSYLDSVNSTALVLMGIGAGVTLAAATVDSAQQDPGGRTTAVAKAHNEVQVAQGALQIQSSAEEAAAAAYDAAVNAQGALAAVAPNPAAVAGANALVQATAQQVATASQGRRAAEGLVAAKESRLKAARNETETFWIDILSDADGVTVHRFQNVVWTLVLGIVFMIQTCTSSGHKMPDFDPSLLTLMGISAATYVGMKVPEAKVPSPQT